MLKHMLKIYVRILISCWSTFGFGKVFLGNLVVVPAFLLWTHATLWLDNIFFRRYRKVKVEKPVFIVGIPRSGTTFLHHLLAQASDVAAFEAWHIMFPALTARFLVAPLIRRKIRKNRAVVVPAEVGHGVSVDKTEEEELLFSHVLDTQFVLHFLHVCLDDQEHPSLRFHDQQPHRQQSVRFFKSLLQRQIHYTGNTQVVAQTHYSTHRIKTLLEAFPDAKFIYLARSPCETIPSHLSLARATLDHRMLSEYIPPDKEKRYLDRTYRYDVELYRYFHDLQEEQAIPEGQLLVLQYKRLRSQLKEAFDEVVAFTGIEPTDELQQAVEQQIQKQPHYKRKHRVSALADFGLSEEKIRKDLSFVFEQYRLDA